MGKFNEYSQKATPEDADSLMIYDAAAKANKLSPFSGIWNWIVGKLTNAVISNLQTNNQTVIGALNELNSKPLTAELHDVDIEDYIKKLGQNSYGLLYFSYNNKNGPVINGFKWNFFTLIVIRSRIIAFSPSGDPDAIITRQFIDTAWTNWVPINSTVPGLSGNIKRVGFRSGQSGLKNIYLDFYDSNNSKTSVAFTTDGENTIKFLVNDEEKWKVVVK